jgi:hypothetical protein
MPSSSTLTAPIAGRVRIDDAETLRRVADGQGITISALLRRLVQEAAPRLAA